jgi:hypothetical protein
MLLCQGGAGFEGVEDEAGGLSFEAADCFAAALAVRLFVFEVGVGPRLGDRDAVEGAVELAVAAAVDPVALDAA